MHAEICQAMMLPGRRHRRRLHYQSRTVRFFMKSPCGPHGHTKHALKCGPNCGNEARPGNQTLGL